MKHRLLYIFAVFCLLDLTAFSSVTPAGSTDSKVHAVLFYSPVCPHCHKVITEIFPPLFAQYAGKLDIVGVNTTTPGGEALFQSAIQAYGIPEGRRGVPVLIVWNYVLVAPEEIGAIFPGLVKSFLEQGGAEFPPIPGLKEQIAKDRAQVAQASGQNAGGAGTPDFAVSPPYARELSVVARLARDPVGNSLAIALLAGMMVVCGRVVLSLRRPAQNALPSGRDWPIPMLSLIGLAVAGYLTYVQTGRALAICGPVGDCNLVQQSPYARLFGIVPVSILGIAGYAAIICAWALARYGSGRAAKAASLALLATAFIGTLVSIYLTFLEPFIIGAACLWCLISAMVMTALLWCCANRFRFVSLFQDSNGVGIEASSPGEPVGPRKSPKRRR